MSYALSRSALGAALAVASFGAVPLMAQEAPETSTRTGEVEEREQVSSSGDTPWQADPIHVTAKGTAADWPSATATDLLSYDAAIAQPQDFQDWITRLPGVGSTGQNGLFETFSIRGSGGNGILILAGGVPVASQRRAGIPVAFVEPQLLGNVNVTRGPAVVHFGPGALGGAVSLEPRWFDAPFLSAGYAGGGNETTLVAATGGEGFSLGMARHRAGDTEAPDGTPLNTSYARDSATLQFRHRFGALELDALLMPSRTEDIGKSNSRYPGRQVTTYPEDNHTIGRLRVQHDNGFQASVYAHDQELGTFKQTPRKADEFAFIGSIESGATVQHAWSSGDFSNDVGVEYFGRRDVDGYDAVGNPGNRTYSLQGARENSWSLFALTDWRVAPQFALELGARTTWIDQYQSGASSADGDSAFTAGAIWTPTAASRWTFNLASGYRFASLEERFYSGVTGRGDIVGNPNLGSEHSLGADLGYAWRADGWNTQMHLWRTDVDDLIQKVELAPDVEGYVNVGQAKLWGAEAVLGWTSPSGLSLHATGAVVHGADKASGEPLYGIPPVRVSLDAAYDVGDFTLSGRYTHRWAMSRPGFEEVRRDAVNTLDAELRYRVSPDLNVKLYVRNATNASYYATADELSAFAPQRSVGFNVVWAMQ